MCVQDSLGGNTKTVMCANAGPAEYNYDETISTLRYANRAKNIKNKPKINEDPKDAMLREYQEEIQRLKSQLSGMGDGGEGMVMIDGQEVNINNIKGGVSEEYLKELKEKADQEKDEIKRRAEKEMRELMDQKDVTEGDKRALKEKLEKESKARMDMENQRLGLQNKLKAMEEKLIAGGEMANKAAKQEAELRQAEQDLAQRKESEVAMARQVAEQEEMNLELEEKFGSLQDEVDAKTKKLKKLWTKFQSTKVEIKDLTEEFQVEKGDMLETIRDLTRQLKLKEVIIQNFVPPEEARQFDDVESGGRAVWREEQETWIIPRTEITGNALRPSRHVSANGLKRPETEYSRHRKQYDTNPRYKYDNVTAMDMDMPEKTTQDYEGPNMASRISPILSMNLGDDDGDEVQFSAVENSLGNPYLHYDPDAVARGGAGENEGGREGNRKKDGGKKKKKDRPSTATRRKDKGERAEAKSEYDFGAREEYK